MFAGRRRFILEGMSEGTRILQAEVADPQASQLVQLRYFAGLTEAAAILEVSPPSADRAWAYARAWRLREMSALGGAGSVSNRRFWEPIVSKARGDRAPNQFLLTLTVYV